MDLKKRDLPRGYGSAGSLMMDRGRYAVEGTGKAPDWSYDESKEYCKTYERRPKRNQWKFKVRKSDGQTKVMTAKKVYRNECPEDKPQPAVVVTSAKRDDRNERAYWQAGYQSKFKRLV